MHRGALFGLGNTFGDLVMQPFILYGYNGRTPVDGLHIYGK